jgi:hypothetical protein
VTIDNGLSLGAYLSPTSKFLPAILGVLPHDAVDLYDEGLVDEIEDSTLRDRASDRLWLDVEVVLEQLHEPVGIRGTELHDEVDVSRHARNGVVVQRH